MLEDVMTLIENSNLTKLVRSPSNTRRRTKATHIWQLRRNKTPLNTRLQSSALISLTNVFVIIHMSISITSLTSIILQVTT